MGQVKRKMSDYWKKNSFKHNATFLCHWTPSEERQLIPNAMKASSCITHQKLQRKYWLSKLKAKEAKPQHDFLWTKAFSNTSHQLIFFILVSNLIHSIVDLPLLLCKQVKGARSKKTSISLVHNVFILILELKWLPVSRSSR